MKTGITPSFFDDINIVASTDRCLAAIQYAREMGKSFGLYPQPHKFAIFLGVCNSFEEAFERKQAYKFALALNDGLSL